MARPQSRWKLNGPLEVAEAVIRTGLKKRTATGVIRRLLDWLNGKPVEPPQRVVDCYDLVHHRPKPAYQEIYLKVKDQFAQAGLNFG
jgi:hypothetical protein